MRVPRVVLSPTALDSVAYELLPLGSVAGDREYIETVAPFQETWSSLSISGAMLGRRSIPEGEWRLGVLAPTTIESLEGISAVRGLIWGRL